MTDSLNSDQFIGYHVSPEKISPGTWISSAKIRGTRPTHSSTDDDSHSYTYFTGSPKDAAKYSIGLNSSGRQAYTYRVQPSAPSEADPNHSGTISQGYRSRGPLLVHSLHSHSGPYQYKSNDEDFELTD